MIPALIDLHVRPQPDDDGVVDYGALAEDARGRGLDGLVLYGVDQSWDLEAAGEASQATGVHFFSGVEVDTDLGRLLCLPRETDAWFKERGWRALAPDNGGGPAVYPGEALIAAFTERGGAVIVAQPFDRDLAHPCAEEAFTQSTGLSAVVVSSNPKHAMSNDKALKAARKANLPCVAGSAAHPGLPHFGSVATIFATPPADQALLVEALRRGRVWPVEIGVKQVGAEKVDEGRKERPAREAREPREVREPREPKVAVEPRKQKARRAGRNGDDNRGNRLQINNRHAPEQSPYDSRQPDFDPIARLYGIDGRRQNKTQHLSDDELDRINGNRNRGPDPNVMSRPDFGELRAERHHINLLLATIDPHAHADADSISLRFALADLVEGSEAPAQGPSASRRPSAPTGAGARRRRGRRRRV